MCGKVFKNTALANFHAEKSGHDQFEESTEEVRQRRPMHYRINFDPHGGVDQTSNRRGEETKARRATGEDGRETCQKGCRGGQGAQGQ